MRHLAACDACGQRIALVLVIPEHPKAGKRRSFIPMDPDFDAAVSPIAPSHALSAGRTTCRPLTADHPLAPHEHAALTHFATCPMRRSTSAPAMSRPRRLALVLLQQERRLDVSLQQREIRTPGGPATRVRPSATLAAAAARAHTAVAYWRLDNPALAADYELAAALLEDRYLRVWNRNPA